MGCVIKIGFQFIGKNVGNIKNRKGEKERELFSKTFPRFEKGLLQILQQESHGFGETLRKGKVIVKLLMAGVLVGL